MNESSKRYSGDKFTFADATVQLPSTGVPTISCSTWGLLGQRKSKCWLLLSHQNRSSPWEPRPVCFSSCSPFFIEAATQDRTAASTVMPSALQWCSWPLVSKTSPASQKLLHHKPSFSEVQMEDFWLIELNCLYFFCASNKLSHF